MRLPRVACAAALVLALSGPMAFGVAGSNGQVRIDVKFSYLVRPSVGGGGVQVVLAEIPAATLQVGSTRQDVVRLTGDVTRIAKPGPRIVTTPQTLDGTFVIAGLTEHKATTKVPVLGDIPVLGGLFDARKEASDRANLLVFITPTIVGVPEKRAAPFLEVGGPIEVQAGATTGSVRIDRTFRHYKGSYKTRFSGVIQEGPNAGRTIKGKLRLSFAGDRN